MGSSAGRRSARLVVPSVDLAVWSGKFLVGHRGSRLRKNPNRYVRRGGSGWDGGLVDGKCLVELDFLVPEPFTVSHTWR